LIDFGVAWIVFPDGDNIWGAFRRHLDASDAFEVLVVLFEGM